MEVGFPFQGQIYYNAETSYKSGMTGTQYVFSDAVRDVRIETGDINQTLATISQASIADISKTMEDPMLHVEWVLQPNGNIPSAVSACWNRIAGDLDSLAIEVETCRDRSTPSYYHMIGCKCKNFTVSGTKGENYIISADFSVASMWVNNNQLGSTPSALGTEYAAFNRAGAITWAGVTGAYVTESFEFTVDNNVTDYYDIGSTSKKACIPGAITITGSCDISVNDGGGNHFTEVLAGTDITSVILNTGVTTAGSGNGKFTLSNGRFDSTNLDLSLSGEGLISSVPFTFRYLAIAIGT